MTIEANDAERDDLRLTIIGGVQSVEADGRKVVYRSLGDLLRTKQLLDESAGQARRRLTTFSRGYE